MWEGWACHPRVSSKTATKNKTPQALPQHRTAHHYTPAGYPQAISPPGRDPGSHLSCRPPNSRRITGGTWAERRRKLIAPQPAICPLIGLRARKSGFFALNWHKPQKLCIVADFVGLVAQSVEQRIENPCVGGSIPPQATRIIGNAGSPGSVPEKSPALTSWAFCFPAPGKPVSTRAAPGQSARRVPFPAPRFPRYRKTLSFRNARPLHPPTGAATCAPKQKRFSA